ncbi:nudC domain-containing protein 3-like isoform X2 [Adelges cooleyi]|uniref:nudC domain-containing protein 3-like isoform X2 n=1 Tax=Adelges cooleyi TaxID=133065 RepID=UPI00218064FD|nr:nudC domain-containing protein 3-like isoform X2 [Adelges cooleyi]
METEKVSDYLNPKFDQLFLNIAKEINTIDEFLYAFFQFLFKRTIFMECANNETEAISLLNTHFKNWWSRSMEEKTEYHSDLSFVDLSNQIVDHIEEITLTDDKDKIVEELTIITKDYGKNLQPILSTDSSQRLEENGNRDENSFVDRCFEISNGADLGLYWWSQTYNDICINIDVSDLIKSSKDINIDVTSQNLFVKINHLNSWRTIIQDTFYKTISDHIWTLTPEKHIQIHLDKLENEFWSKCLSNETSTVDKKNIDSHIPFHELPENEQNKINEVVNKNNTKEEDVNENLEKLKKAWNLPGSPFAGTPFNPDTIQFPFKNQ